MLKNLYKILSYGRDIVLQTDTHKKMKSSYTFDLI